MKTLLLLLLSLVAIHGVWGSPAPSGVAAPELSQAAASAFGIEPLLAQLPDPKSHEALAWLLGAAVAGILAIGGVISAVIGGLTLIEKIRGRTSPTQIAQPLEVSAAVRWARHDELHQLRTEFEGFREVWDDNASALRSKIDEKFSEAIQANNSSASKTHQRIDAMASKQGEMIGEMKQISENVGRLLSRLTGGGK